MAPQRLRAVRSGAREPLLHRKQLLHHSKVLSAAKSADIVTIAKAVAMTSLSLRHAIGQS